MDEQSLSVKPLCSFIESNLNQLLTFQTDGNPFLIGRPVEIDCCNIVTVLEVAGYISYVPLEEIVEVHTVVS